MSRFGVRRILEKNALSSSKLVLMLIALVVGGLPGLGTVSAQSGVDYDADDDGLIEIEWLEQLDAMRWDLDGDGVVNDGNAERYFAAFPDAAEGMGCAERCRGYELTRNLDFKSAGSYASGVVNGKWTGGNGWLPIGVIDAFRATFEGNERTIANLYIDRRGNDQPEAIGLLGVSGGEIIRIGLVNVDVSGENNAGGIVGTNVGNISYAYATGSVSGDDHIGGLVGENSGFISHSHSDATVKISEETRDGNSVGGLVGGNNGIITSSRATGTVSGEVAGGLIGESWGRSNISSSYATGTVSGDIAGGLIGSGEGNITSNYSTSNVAGRFSGGLIGIHHRRGNVTSSYATGNVSVSVPEEASSQGVFAGGLAGENRGSIKFSYTTSNVRIDSDVPDAFIGGFVGKNDEANGISSSYWNTETSGQSAGVGEGPNTGVEGKTTAELQEPTDYTGIYADWLTDFDNADEDFDETTGVDDVWDFGTSSQYPELKADLDNSGHASWWEFGPQHGRPQPTPTPTPIATETPTPTATATQTTTPTPTPTPTSDTSVHVVMQDLGGSGKYAFSPSEMSFKVGERVTFILTSETEFHTFEVDDLDIYVEVDAGETVTFDFVFDKAGTYELICTPHSPQGKIGTITVKSATDISTPTHTATPTPTDTPVPTTTATHTPMPTDTPEPISTPEPTATPVPPTQTPVIIVVTATPSADAPSGGGCNSVGAVPVGAGAASLFLLLAPLGVVGGVRWGKVKAQKAYNSNSD